jgi:UDP-glucuronate 4-epimerase
MPSTNVHTRNFNDGNGNSHGIRRLIGLHWNSVVTCWIVLVIIVLMTLPYNFSSKPEQLNLARSDLSVTTKKEERDKTADSTDTHPSLTSTSTQQDFIAADTNTATMDSEIDSSLRALDIIYEQEYAESNRMKNDDDDDEISIEPYTYLEDDGGMSEIGDIVDGVIGPISGNKKVLVTGGAGFIGSHVAKALLDRGDAVVIIDEMNDYYDVQIKLDSIHMLQEQFGDDRIKVYFGDICNSTLMSEIFEVEKPKWICHMAARAGVRNSISDPFMYIHSNIEGTTRLLELSVQYGGIVNFVMASSSSVYGNSDNEIFSEFNQVDEPLSPYAATKKACELLAYTYHHLYGINITALRFFTVYGPRGRPDMAPFKFIDSISRGTAIQQYGDGSSIRDYTFIDDIVDGVLRSIDRPYPFEIINLGNNNGTSLKEFISFIEHYTARKATIDIVDVQPGDVQYTQADIRKAQKLLGYHPQTSIQEGIEQTIRWYQSTLGLSGDE